MYWKIRLNFIRGMDVMYLRPKKSRKLLIVSIALVVILISSCARPSSESDTAQDIKVSKKEGWTEVGKDIFVFTSDFYLANMVLVRSKNEGILIDTGMNQTDREKIEKFLAQHKIDLKRIIITHSHGDHVGNLEGLTKKGISVITPENAKPNQTIKLREKKLNILFTEGHYAPKGHISVEVENNNILIAGDVICNNILPPIASGGHIEDLLKTLETLEKRGYSLIIPGHGEIEENESIFKRQFEYLNNVKRLVEDVISSGGSAYDLNSIKLEDCMEDTSYLHKERLDYWHKRGLETVYWQLKK